MTKTERLIHIINLLNSHKVVGADKIIKECNISKRTVFRDMAQLAKLNFPVYYDDGYRLLGRKSLPTQLLTNRQISFIRFCLRTSAFNQSNIIKAEFNKIDELLNGVNGMKNGHLFKEIENLPTNKLKQTNIKEQIIMFIEAVLNESLFRAKNKKGKCTSEYFKPSAIIFSEDEIGFELVSKDIKSQIKISLAEMADFRIVAE